MTAHPANAVFRAVQSMAAPLDVLETEARNIWPQGAQRGSLFVLWLGAPTARFSYQWGDCEIARSEAARRIGEQRCEVRE